MSTPSFEEIKELLSYNPATGQFFWNERKDSRNGWNKRWAGKCAGTKNAEGYIVISIRHRSYKAHRLAWVIFYGEWPELMVDHINHDKEDNSIHNLRLASDAESQRNKPLWSRNNSGHFGVSYREQNKRPWIADIYVNGGHIFLGSFASRNEAVAARAAAEKKYGFHRNHGKSRERVTARSFDGSGVRPEQACRQPGPFRNLELKDKVRRAHQFWTPWQTHGWRP